MASRAHKITDTEWGMRRGEIQELYIEQRLTLKAVIKQMDERKFVAS